MKTQHVKNCEICLPKVVTRVKFIRTANKLKANRRKEIIKIREINEVEKRKTLKKIKETKLLFLVKINKVDPPVARFTKKKREYKNYHSQK